MKKRNPTYLALLGALTACVVPASLLERSSVPGSAPPEPPPDYWQGRGRYRQEAPEARGAQPATTDPLCAGPQPAESAEFGAPPLLAWDGGVIAGAPQGVVTEESGTPRGLQSPPGGRMHIIELYQQVLDERDALAEEVESLQRALEQTGAALEEERRKSAQLELRVAGLEEGHRGLLEENRELAARLATAQIRRLEAEKLLLEARIEAHRARAAQAAEAQVKPVVPARAEGKRKAEPEPEKKDGGGGGGA